MCILEFSKTFMYDFHYSYIRNRYCDKVKILFTGTDNLANDIRTHNMHEDFYDNTEPFYFSQYPKDQYLLSLELLQSN